ncbi:MAG: hypothetical protein CVV10_00920 [Gammaproteobacteria bacterium HGW-Gammaproteobacteria-14]|nr:MAG: hypothetical protein CVV10_00920 [Gammaproteobacteria bacterium HGW-Gammaproteobacteria-14]
MRTLLLALGLCFMATIVAASEGGTLIANTPLYDRPNGEVKGSLLANTLVEVGERQGGWYAVSASGGRQGWVRIGSVRLAGEAESESMLSGFLSWLNQPRSSATGNSTTAGIRGLDAGDINAAAANYDAVERMERWRVTPAAARRHAEMLPLRERSVPPLADRK